MDKLKSEFYKIKNHGFYKVTAATPLVELGDISKNLEQTIALTKLANKQKSNLIVFPELCLTGYTLADNFHQRAYLDEVKQAISKLVKFSKTVNLLICVGAPLEFNNCLYNCAVIIQSGKILGINIKSYLPNYDEYYEKRYFSSLSGLQSFEVELLGFNCLAGNNLIYKASERSDIKVYFEICEDAWTVVPKSSYAALSGASLIVNLSASNALAGKGSGRMNMFKSRSEQYLSSYIYASSGLGESTTDLLFDGQTMIIELGEVLAAAKKFNSKSDIITTSIDFDLIQFKRRRRSSFVDQAKEYDSKFQLIDFTSNNWKNDTNLQRNVNPWPFIKNNNPDNLEVIDLQAHSLATRMKSSSISKLVLGVSGGLDSTLAAIVGVRTMELLQLPISNLLVYKLPSKANSLETKNNANSLIEALNLKSNEINIDKLVEQTKLDMKYKTKDEKRVGISKKKSDDKSDVVFENIQAGARASLLFRLANHNNAMVLGTGDLSELALGFTTYGIGDHMSHYNPNSSLAKTQIKHTLYLISQSNEYSEKLRKALTRIIKTEISPELAASSNNDKPTQLTEEIIGPYQLNDFFLYNKISYGFAPSKIAFLAYQSFCLANYEKSYQEFVQPKTNKFKLEKLFYHLEQFYIRFISAQFKRSSMPDGAKVGSAISLSPRGDWKSPSDLSNKTFLSELKKYHK